VGRSDVHYGVVHYGEDARNLDQTAKNPIRLNQGHPDTTFRVRLQDLKPGTTYYYTVTSLESGGRSDNVKTDVQQFTTP
jgi:Purple acid Phosphatase, N-terminal domain